MNAKTQIRYGMSYFCIGNYRKNADRNINSHGEIPLTYSKLNFVPNTSAMWQNSGTYCTRLTQ